MSVRSSLSGRIRGRIGAQHKTGPAVVDATVLRTLTPTEEGLMVNSTDVQPPVSRARVVSS